jgi:hypothetical protein
MGHAAGVDCQYMLISKTTFWSAPQVPMKQYLKCQMVIKHPDQTPFKNRPNLSAWGTSVFRTTFGREIFLTTRSVEIMPSSPINP